MDILMTGGTGYIGRVVAERLVAAGHRLTVLTRTAPAPVPGIGWVQGSITDHDLLAGLVPDADAVVFAAWALAPDGGAVPGAVAALLDAAPRGIPFLWASSSMVYGDTGPDAVDEDAPLAPPDFEAWRAEVDRAVLGATARGRIAGAVVRPALVYGRGGNLVLRSMVGSATGEGVVRVVGPGTNGFSAVHVDDLADLHARVLSSGSTGAFHAASEQHTLRDLALAAARAVGPEVRVEHLDVEAAAAAFGVRAYAEAQTYDQLVDARRARAELGWSPTGPALGRYLSDHVADLAAA